MTDCNGVTIGVGDVVEVVESQPHERGEWVATRMSWVGDETKLRKADGQPLGLLGWYKGSELRLVRRKEKA